MQGPLNRRSDQSCYFGKLFELIKIRISLKRATQGHFGTMFNQGFEPCFDFLIYRCKDLFLKINDPKGCWK